MPMQHPQTPAPPASENAQEKLEKLMIDAWRREHEQSEEEETSNA